MTILEYFAAAISLAIFVAASANSINWLFEENVLNDLEIEYKKRIEKDNIKLRMMEFFGMKEPPGFSDSSPRLSDEVIRLLIERDEQEQAVQQQSNSPSLMILPSNSNFECQWYNVSPCQRFEYKISPEAVASTPELWVHVEKSRPTKNLTISLSCSPLDHQKYIKQENIEFQPDGNGKSEWTFFQLSTLKNFRFWRETTSCVIEITGMVIDQKKTNLPFLKLVKDTDAHKRKKRAADDNIGRHDSCETIPFTISFKEIGFNDIVYPDSFEANICKGSCFHVQNHNEYLMLEVFKRNKNLTGVPGCQPCWFTCCRPKQYANLRVFYKNDSSVYDSTIIDINMVNMIIQSCHCD